MIDAARRPGLRPRLWPGLLVALLSAMAFALSVVCVSIVLEHGGSVHAVNAVRPVFFLLCLGLLALASPGPRRLAPRERNLAFLIGALMCVEMYAVHNAIGFIPVGLAILVMYLYPVLVTLTSSLLERRALRPALLLSALLAFVGLGLALDPFSGRLDPRGVGLAVIAAIGMTVLVLVSDRVMRAGNRLNVMLHVNLAAGAIMLALVLAGAPLIWPAGAAGLLALLAATTLYVLATFLLFVAVSMIGAVRFAVIDNTSPVWAIAFGAMMLGQQLNLQQYLGALLVVGGVIAVQLLYRPAAETVPEPLR